MKQLLEQYSCDWSADSERIILTPGAAARESCYYIQEIGFFRAGPAYFTRRENLDSFLILYTLAGRGKLIADGVSRTLEAGSAFFIDCSRLHEYRAFPLTETAGGSAWDFLWVHFYGSGSRGYHRRFEQGCGGAVLRTAPPETRGLLETLQTLAKSPSPGQELLISLRLTELLTVLTLAAGGAEDEDERPGRQAYIDEALNYIDRHLAQPLSLTALAALFARNRYTFLRDFKARTGSTPGEYIIGRRVNLAKELLKYTDQSVKQVAWRTGIASESHFIRLFHAREGMTPAAFRRLWCGPGSAIGPDGPKQN